VAKTLVLGLGNPILTDDGVGIHVVRAVASRFQQAAVDLAEASVGGLRLLDRLVGYERVVIVDAILTEEGKPGTIYRLGPGDLRASLHSGSSHDLSLRGALGLGRQLGMSLPADDQITLIGIEAADVLQFGLECTPPVASAIPFAVQQVLDELSRTEFTG
jgi:hydrogenase maturation protease